LVGAPLLLVPALVSCGADCDREGIEALLIARSDTGCPPASAARPFAQGDHSPESLAGAAPFAPDRTMCWYRFVRRGGATSLCLDEPLDSGSGTMSRAFFLARATRTEPRPVEETIQDLLSCDENGDLFGHLLRETSGVIRKTPTLASCPAPAELEGVPSFGEATELVGSDLYPALVTCSYKITWQSECFRMGAPPGPL
jgi:hypothetical protein